MPVSSTPFGPVVLTGDDAKSFSRKVRSGRGSKAAAESLANGRRLVAEFAERGAVTIKLRTPQGHKR